MLKTLLVILIFLNCNKYKVKMEQKSKGNSKIIEIFKRIEQDSQGLQYLCDILGVNMREVYSFFNYPLSNNLDFEKNLSKEDNVYTDDIFEKLEFSEKINILDEYGLSIFHYSILYSGGNSSISMLLALGADINFPTSEGKSPIFLLLESKFLFPELDKSTLQKYNCELRLSKFQTLLRFANEIDFDFKYKKNNFETYIKKLLSISVKLKDFSEDAMIDFEFYSNLNHMLETPKKVKAKNIDLDNKNIYLNQNESEEILESLCSHNLNKLKESLKFFKDKEISTIMISNNDLLINSIHLEFLEGIKFLIPYFNLNNPVYLKYSLILLKKDIVLEFLPKISNINFYDENGFTLLMLLSNLNIRKDQIQIWKELIEILIKRGAKVNLPCLNSNYLNSTALYFVLLSHVEMAEFLINMGAEININTKDLKVKKDGKYNFNLNPLEYAIFIKSCDMVELLIKKGASTACLKFSDVLYDVSLYKRMCDLLFPHIKGKLNFSKNIINSKEPLLYDTLMKLRNLPIIAKENLSTIEKMIKDFKENVNYEPNNGLGQNCLFLAINTKCSELVELLLKNGAKATRKDTFDNIYTEAIFRKNPEILKLLLDYNIRINFRTDDPLIPLPLNLAVKLGSREMAKALLEDKKLPYDKLKLISDIILGSEALDLSDVYDKDIINKYPTENLIHITALVGSHKNLRFLINEGYSPFLKTDKEIKFENINYNFFKEREQNSKINFLNFHHIRKGQSALDIVMKKQDLKAFSIIMEFYKEQNLEKDVKEFIENNYIFGNKTLLVNIEKGYYGIVKVFLDNQNFSSLLLDINYVDEDNNTLLDYLLENENNESKGLLILLKEKDALRAKEVKERIRIEEEENSLINNIVKGNKAKILEIVANNKFEVIKADDNNITPLNACVINNRLDILKLIIKILKEINKLSNNIDRVDIENKTALSHAIDSRNYEIIKILLESGSNVNFKYCRRYSYVTGLAFDNSNESREIIKILHDNNIVLSSNDIKFLFKKKNSVNPYLLKLFESQLKKYESLYSFKIEVNKKVSKIEKILIDKGALKFLENISKENLNKLNSELKKCLKGENFSDSRDLSNYKPKFGEIRLINNMSSDRIFYIKKGNYLVILDIYLNKRKRLLPNYIYDKAFEKCKLYKMLINKNNIEILESCTESMNV